MYPASRQVSLASNFLAPVFKNFVGQTHSMRQYMSKPTTTHSERTSTIFRSPDIHQVILTAVRFINPAVRTYVLSSTLPIQFLPGQWLDVHAPGYSKPGGYTITSPPRLSVRSTRQIGDNESLQEIIEKEDDERFEIHLAIQDATGNPVTEFLWREPSALIGTPLQIRVGGNFTWPPSGSPPQSVVFVAGGVGINPLMSMLSHIYGLKAGDKPECVELLYGFKIPPLGSSSNSSSNIRRVLQVKDILFLPELLKIQRNWSPSGSMKLRVFVTGDAGDVEFEKEFPSESARRRISENDVREAFAASSALDKSHSVGYVCGPPEMTDQMVQLMKDTGLEESNVFCEKWW